MLGQSAGRFGLDTGATEQEAFRNFIENTPNLADTRGLYQQMGNMMGQSFAPGSPGAGWARFAYTPETATQQMKNILNTSQAALGVGGAFGQNEALKAIYGQMAAEDEAQAGQNFANWVSSAWNPANQVTWGQ